MTILGACIQEAVSMVRISKHTDGILWGVITCPVVESSICDRGVIENFPYMCFSFGHHGTTP